MLRLTLLAPEIVEAILDGRQVPELTLPMLMGPPPVEWERQCWHLREKFHAWSSRPKRRRFAAYAVRLQLHALAYNLANLLRTRTLPEAISHWSMTLITRTAGQDRREDRPAWAIDHVPDG